MRRFDHSSQYPFRLSLQILRHGTTTTNTTKILLAIQQTRLFPSTLLPKPLHNDAGPSIVLSYATSGLSALLSVFCYTEFAVEIPVAGGSFSFLRIELSDFLAFIATGNILLEAVVGAAGLGHSWSSYFAIMIKSNADFLRIRVNSFAKGFNLLDPIAVVVLAIDNTIAMSGTHRTSCLNWVASIFSAGLNEQAPDCETLFQNLLDHVNANGEQMPIASSSMIRSHSVSGDLHGVQLDPVAADILRKELEHETFVRLKISPTSILHLLALSMQSNYLRIASYQKCSICILQIKHVYQDANSIAEFLTSYVVLYGRNSDFSENGKLPTARRVLLGVLGSELFYCLSSVGRRSFVLVVGAFPSWVLLCCQSAAMWLCAMVHVLCCGLGVIALLVPPFWSSPLLLVCTVKGLGDVIDVVEVHVLLGVLGSFKRLPWFSISLDAVCDVLLGCWFWGRVFPADGFPAIGGSGLVLHCSVLTGMVLCYAAGLLFLLCVVLCTVYVTVHVNSLPVAADAFCYAADVDEFSTTLLSCWLLAAASLLDFSWILALSHGFWCFQLVLLAVFVGQSLQCSFMVPKSAQQMNWNFYVIVLVSEAHSLCNID
ncbi:unnamed protein product [Ilex paraguariensis]|uniref:Uncharacterized protein n=1 Tax=Ilex paraguariensis TaxID=185542 RepID=A0ABC8UE51_9AQUA